MCPCINKKITYKNIRNKLIKSYINSSTFDNNICKGFLKHAMQYTYAIINYWNIQQKFSNQKFKHEYIESEIEQKYKIEEIEECEEHEQNNKTNYLREKIYYNDFVNSLDENFVQVTDIHGDLNSLLIVLVGNKYYVENGILPCKFIDNEPCVVYFDIKSGKTIKNPKHIFNYTNLVPIPNLEINPKFKGKFILNGDLIDKGLQSEVCFYTMYNILQQEEAKNKIFYLLGNHESLLISENYNSSILNSSSSFFSGGTNRLSLKYNPNYYLSAENYNTLKSRLEKMNSYIKKLIKEDKMVYSTVVGKVLFSHTYLNSDVIVNLINELKNNDNSYEKYTDIANKLLNNEIEKNKNNELTTDNIQTISNLLNKSVKSYINIHYNMKNGCIPLALCELYERVFDCRGKYNLFLGNLLWEQRPKHLACNQIIGHVQTYNKAIQFKYIDKDDMSVLHTDTARSRDIYNYGYYSFLQYDKNELTLYISSKIKYLYSSLVNIVNNYNLMPDVQLPSFTINNFMPIRSLNNKLKDENDNLNTAVKEFTDVLLKTAESCNIIKMEQ